MRLHIAAVLRDALGLWRRDRAILGPLAGLLLFLPQWALLLLVPDAPRIGDDPDRPAAAMAAWSQAFGEWFAANGGWYVAALLLGQYATLTIAALYLGEPRGDLRGAMRRAPRLLPRYLLAGIAVALPLAAVAGAALSLPGGLFLAMPLIFLALGRFCLAAPVLAAQPRTGALSALARSWALTAGRGIAVAVLVGGLTGVGQLVASVVLAIDQVLTLGGMGNPVTLAVVDAGAAAASCAAAVALALVEVALYRRLAR